MRVAGTKHDYNVNNNDNGAVPPEDQLGGKLGTVEELQNLRVVEKPKIELDEMAVVMVVDRHGGSSADQGWLVSAVGVVVVRTLVGRLR